MSLDLLLLPVATSTYSTYASPTQMAAQTNCRYLMGIPMQRTLPEMAFLLCATAPPLSHLGDSFLLCGKLTNMMRRRLPPWHRTHLCLGTGTKSLLVVFTFERIPIPDLSLFLGVSQMVSYFEVLKIFSNCFFFFF